MTKQEYLQNFYYERGRLLATEIYEDAKNNPDCPLKLEWDDSKAGYEYRLWQIRQAIKTVKITYLDKETPAYRSVNITREDGGIEKAYMSIEAVTSDEDLYRQTMLDAIRRIKYWQNEYSTINELQRVINNDELKRLELSLV